VFRNEETNGGDLGWSIYIHMATGSTGVPYRVPYSDKFNFDYTRKSVAEIIGVLQIGLLVHCKREGNLR
jgi:hypothetical protein